MELDTQLTVNTCRVSGTVGFDRKSLWDRFYGVSEVELYTLCTGKVKLMRHVFARLNG